ncbi:hypothetical protein [Streptomyces sp. NPDC002054]|uniref:hypothetical protein n=1 Tax=Streptomyces sp. NPDC002054 TaxID=3154663 RepID=UPI00331B5772
MTSNTTNATTGTPRGLRVRRGLGAALAVAAVALAGWTVAGWYGGGDGGLVVLVTAREHQVVTVWLVLAALFGALALGVRHGPFKAGGYVCLSLAALPALVLAQFTSSAEESARTAAPGRADRHLVVHRDHVSIDPIWLVYVQQGTWPRERRWLLGSFDGDAEDNELAGAVWDGADRVRLDTAGGETYLVGVGPSGRPDRRISVP